MFNLFSSPSFYGPSLLGEILSSLHVVAKKFVIGFGRMNSKRPIGHNGC